MNFASDYDPAHSQPFYVVGTIIKGAVIERSSEVFCDSAAGVIYFIKVKNATTII
jgi:hypothetical protein